MINICTPWWHKCELHLFSAILPRKLQENKGSIVTVVSTSGGDMLQRDCGELDYRIDVCHGAQGVHTAHL